MTRCCAVNSSPCFANPRAQPTWLILAWSIRMPYLRTVMLLPTSADWKSRMTSVSSLLLNDPTSIASSVSFSDRSDASLRANPSGTKMSWKLDANATSSPLDRFIAPDISSSDSATRSASWPNTTPNLAISSSNFDACSMNWKPLRLADWSNRKAPVRAATLTSIPAIPFVAFLVLVVRPLTALDPRLNPRSISFPVFLPFFPVPSNFLAKSISSLVALSLRLSSRVSCFAFTIYRLPLIAFSRSCS